MPLKSCFIVIAIHAIFSVTGHAQFNPPRPFCSVELQSDLFLDPPLVKSMISKCPDSLPGNVLYKPKFQQNFIKSLEERVFPGKVKYYRSIMLKF